MDGKARRDAFGRRELLVLSALGLVAGAPRTAFAGSPQGQLTWAVHFSLAPTWFDPAETPGMITPFLLMYALHDAMVKPMPGNAAEPCLADTVKMAPDGLSYEFTVRAGAKFHNGEPVTAEDVKFSFERYRGTSAALMKERVKAVETPDERRVRFVLAQPWPDFLTFYSSATGAGWIVPKKYVQQVGEDGFKKAPIGAGPYRFVSFTPGVELVFEAFEGYWRKTPAVKRLVFKVVPEEATRLAALKRGEVDLAYSIRGELADELKKTPGLALKPVVIQGTFWLYFPDQWDSKSPWHDQRVRDAARLAIDYKSISEALTLGYSPITTGLSFLPMIGMLVLAAQLGTNLLVPRLGPKVLVPFGMVLATVGMLMLTRLDLDSSYAPDVLVPLMVVGFAMGSIMPASMQTATLGVDRQYAGVASAMVNTSQQVGGSLGTALLNTIAATAATDYLVDHSPVTPAVAAEAAVQSFATAYWWGAGFFAIGAVLSAVVFRRKGDGLSVATARPPAERSATVPEPSVSVGA